MEVLYFLADIRNSALTIFFNFMTFFGEEILSSLIICILYWCIDKQFAKKITLSFLVSGLFIQNLKITFRIPRPWVIDPNFKPIDSALETATGYSFPSGHTQTSTSIFSTLAFNAKANLMKTIFCIIFILTGISRLYLGVHTPKDVFVSMFFSFTISLIIYKLDVLNKFSYKQISIVLFLMTCIFISYSFFQLHLNYANESLYLDVFKSGGSALAFVLGLYIEPKYINFDGKSGSIFFQIIKVIVGITIALALKAGLKPLLGESAFMSLLRYFLVILWIMIIYPLIFSKIAQKHK